MLEKNEEIIREFISSWSELNADKLADFFSKDGVYHNIPMEPVKGKENVRQFITGFIQPWTETTWDILSIASAGELVIVERLDRTQAGDKAVDLPCVGVFEMQDGKIKVWRDYFDSNTYFEAMA
ncbi:MAG: limonene-1,2-epoxide hydrolase family protein [SAR86 cluster bacterium]|jgi:limonene-1,2-epoxide hydrolase|nr:limonene-1,2-epoxide hydrolase family protein [SAR86 cluster bacterium]